MRGGKEGAKEGTRSAAWRVGLFGLLGLAVLALAIVLAGGHWFVPREAALMRFSTSVYGLQVGAPVVFRGVRLGQITAVDLAPAGPAGVSIPVRAEFERALLRALAGPDAAAGSAALIPELVRRGLVARLATQSLLTGQLYVDLDIDGARSRAPAEPAAAAAPQASPAASAASTLPAAALPPRDPSGLPVIPTAPSQLQSLQAQLEGLDIGQIGRDLAASSAALRQLLASPEPARLLARAADAAQSLQRLSERLEREVAPLSRSAQGAFGEGQRAAAAVGQGAAQAAQSAREAAQQVGAAASQAQGQMAALAAAGVPALVQVQRSAETVSQAAEALRALAGEDSATRAGAERAMADVARAARALRDLAEMLERHPEALIRGRTTTP
jgi:paraquat-inducible protein B